MEVAEEELKQAEDTATKLAACVSNYQTPVK